MKRYITDGKLAFANLYMGRYYLVERATGLVLPIDGNGKLYITGKYPQLNKKLERTGKYSSLATKGGEYTDYIYKNQYSAVAESRKLNGSKAWDGYYLSYAKGYLCDEVNHYKTLPYADESTYHIHAEQESQDEVLKSGFSLQKLVSTTGQPSPALKLEGAGFTVYRISKLSKATQFKQNPDGSYDAASILSAYRKDNYDNATLKYDFTHEGQAIANMFESNTDTVNAYNATLTADGDHANGRGNGWMPTDQPAEYRLGEMFTNDEGIFRVGGLPYGQYLIVETTIPKDVFQCDPFIVTVNTNSPQSRFSVPAGSVTTPSNDYMTFNVLDEELEGYLQLIKTDTETGKAVKIANTAFGLYRLDEKDRKTRISMIDPASGNATKKTDVFYTDADGLMKTPEKLPLGRYLIEELQGPEGYFNDPLRSEQQFLTLPDERWYRTGDLGCYWPDGTIEFLGRRDKQVKVGGYRIELGEIESALSQLAGVKQATVLAIGEKRKNAGGIRCSSGRGFLRYRSSEPGTAAGVAHACGNVALLRHLARDLRRTGSRFPSASPAKTEAGSHRWRRSSPPDELTRYPAALAGRGGTLVSISGDTTATEARC